MIKQSQYLYEFGPFRVDPVERLLLREGQPVRIKAKAFDTLLFLIEKRGHLVEKSEVMKALWRDSFVEESNLTVSMSLLRKALGDDPSQCKYIQTVPRKGYRFVGDVHEIIGAEELAAPEAAKSVPKEIMRSRGARRLLWVLPALVVLGSIASIAASVHFRRSTGTVTPIRSLAVLPFLSSDPVGANEYLRLELPDAIITRLGSTGQITVRPTSAIRSYQNSQASALQAGREQKVDAIVTGSIRNLTTQVRVNVQLVRVSDGSLVWADTFQESSEQLFALEDEVAEKVAQSLSVQLSSGARVRLSRNNTQDASAYQLYLKGRYFWNKRTAEGMRRSVIYFQQAIGEDDGFALAYSGLADSYIQLSSIGTESPRVAYLEAKAAGLKALQIDDASAEAHSSLGMVSLGYEWNWLNAEHEFKSSIELDPNYPVAYTRYAMDLVATGRFEEALAQQQRALQLDPLSLDLNLGLARIFYASRQYQKAVETIRKVIDLDPFFSRAHTRLGMVYLAQGNLGDAIREFEEAQRISGPEPNLEGFQAYAQARAGNAAEARRILEKLTHPPHREYVPAFSVALVYVGLSDFDHALEWLDKAYADRSPNLMYARTDPLLDPLRSEPRFVQLLGRMGLLPGT